jgi:putative transcriptional regulator
MIKHHPTQQLLLEFAKGELSITMSMAVSAHVEMCQCCASKMAAIESNLGEIELGGEEEIFVDSDFSAMFAEIVGNEARSEVVLVPQATLMYQHKEVLLPRALSCVERTEFSTIGKIGRSRFNADDGSLRASLLHIAPGGEIPEHTHTGFEVTLLLDGDFGDEDGEYVPGDFILLDGKHNHTPKTKEGCLCFTVVSSALYFNKGISKLLNPIGSLIY